MLAMEIKDRIRECMAQRNIQAKDIVERTGLTKGTVSQWVNGQTSPRGKNLKLLAKALGTSPEWLMFGVNSSAGGSIMNIQQTVRESANLYPVSNVQPVTKTRVSKVYPVISWVQAGEWTEAVDIFQPGDAEQWESSDAAVSEKAFWLQVVGDSMTASSGISIPEGHIILVDPTGHAENGQLVIVKLTDSNEVTFKKLVIDGGNKYLKPLNPSYRTIEINGNCKLIGVVREAKIHL